MAISTFSELKAAVDSFLHRADLQSSYDEFVALAESDIRNDLETRTQETTATGSVSANAISHPSGLISVIRLTVDDHVLRYVTPAQFATLEDNDVTDWYVYTSIGTSFKVLTGSTYELVYLAAFTALSADADTNWVLTAAPDVYLYGMLKHAAVWTQDDAAAARFAALYQGAVQRLKKKERAAAFGGGTLVVRTDGMVV